MRDAPEHVDFDIRTETWDIRRSLSSTGAIQPAAESGMPVSPWHAPGTFDIFRQETYEAAVLAALSIWGANTPVAADKIAESVDEVYARMDRDWTAKYMRMQAEDRQAALWEPILTAAMRQLRSRRKIIVILRGHLCSTRAAKIAVHAHARSAPKRADGIMCELIRDVIRQLAAERCNVFLYRVFAEMSEEEIARRMRLELKVVKAHSKGSIAMLRKLYKEAAKNHPELLTVLQEEPDQEGAKLS